MLFRKLGSRHGLVSRWKAKAVEALAYINRHQGCNIGNGAYELGIDSRVTGRLICGRGYICMCTEDLRVVVVKVVMDFRVMLNYSVVLRLNCNTKSLEAREV
jgi:hypothetical protein